MEVRLDRLRRGEIVAGASGLALLVFLFVVPWLSAGSGHTRTGWSGLPTLRWVIVLSALTALALTVTQATRAAPAIPVTLSVFATVLGALTTILLIIRLLSTGAGLQVGAWLGLVSAIGIAVGGFLSLRQEDGWRPGPEHPVKTVALRSGRPS